MSARSWRPALWGVIAASLAFALWLAGRYSYLLFHSLVEVFAVVVASAVFLFSWSSRESPDARPFVLLGIGYLFVALVDLLHTLTYEGMTVLPAGRDYATKLWIAARSLQAVATLVFAITVRCRVTVRPALALWLTGSLCGALLASIFWWDIFPLCFVPGRGVTIFKKTMEYIISGVFGLSALLVAGEREVHTARVRLLLVVSFILAIASELVFTLYVSADGIPNLLGHVLKLASFYAVYQAVFATQVRVRLRMITELERSKTALEARERELREANLSKDKFFSILAHDLRSPIGGFLNVSELLSRRFDELDGPTIRRLADSLYDAARQSADLLESILQWARAHTGRLTPRPSPLCLAEMCHGICALSRGPAAAKGVTVRCVVPEGLAVTADADMLATVLRNLMSNAVKFTHRGGEVLLAAERRDGVVAVEVRDSGVGMSAEEVALLFRIDSHFRKDGTASERGNGMGLILVKELVTLNRGSIVVESRPGAGSVFTVKLPAAEQEGRAVHPVDGAGTGGYSLVDGLDGRKD